jgi:hypothetical protein
MVASSACRPTGEAGTPPLESPVRSRLAGDERRPAGRAALLGIIVGEHHALAGDAVDILRLVAHQPEGIGADIGLADIIAHNDKDVRPLAALRHGFFLLGLCGRDQRRGRKAGDREDRSSGKKHVAAAEAVSRLCLLRLLLIRNVFAHFSSAFRFTLKQRTAARSRSLIRTVNSLASPAAAPSCRRARRVWASRAASSS